MAPLEPWEKYLVKIEEFSKDVHGQQSCMDCHGGTQSEDKETAHQGLIHRPSEGENSVCKECHPNVHASYINSLHYTQQGYFTTFEARSVPENHAAFQTAFDNHCAKCHTTCGDCHVSTPISAGGGLFDGHLFKRTPPMTRSCTACHGSRVGDEYLGKHEDIPGDAHFRQGRMNCIDCHSGSALHGEPPACTTCHPGPVDSTQLPPADHRYAGVQSPSCESCHIAVLSGPEAPQIHTQHGSKLSCQVCHSVSYTSCDACHVAISEKTGRPFFETQNTYLTFLIGRNPNPSFLRPYEYVPVRHIPVAPTSYQFYGANLLPNFNALPTWAYATPHNIQRLAPQAATCNACHGNPEIFLTADKVKPEELEANTPVIVNNVPPPIGGNP